MAVPLSVLRPDEQQALGVEFFDYSLEAIEGEVLSDRAGLAPRHAKICELKTAVGVRHAV
jgi:hypothetical protein